MAKRHVLSKKNCLKSGGAGGSWLTGRQKIGFFVFWLEFVA